MQREDGGWMTVRTVYACYLLFRIIDNINIRLFLTKLCFLIGSLFCLYIYYNIFLTSVRLRLQL